MLNMAAPNHQEILTKIHQFDTAVYHFTKMKFCQ